MTRLVRMSLTANDQLNELLAQGADRFGERVAQEKKALFYRTIEEHIAPFTALRASDPDTGLTFYPVSRTPFVLVYDYDDTELRIHFVLHKRADRKRVDLRDAEW